MLQLYRALAETYGRLGLVTKVSFVVGTALAGTALAIAVVVWLPADHFRRDGQAPAPPRGALRLAVVVLKNLLGLVILPMGVIMALPLVPGPGLVFILIGLSLLDFPGKRSLERRLLAVGSVRGFLNQVRRRFRRAPLVFDADVPS